MSDCVSDHRFSFLATPLHLSSTQCQFVPPRLIPPSRLINTHHSNHETLSASIADKASLGELAALEVLVAGKANQLATAEALNVGTCTQVHVLGLGTELGLGLRRWLTQSIYQDRPRGFAVERGPCNVPCNGYLHSLQI